MCKKQTKPACNGTSQSNAETGNVKIVYVVKGNECECENENKRCVITHFVRHQSLSEEDFLRLSSLGPLGMLITDVMRNVYPPFSVWFHLKCLM